MANTNLGGKIDQGVGMEGLPAGTEYTSEYGFHVYINTTGVIYADGLLNGTNVAINVVGGTSLPIMFKKIYSTTTADLIVLK